ncbi:MAG: glycosyltransferase family 2 protein [Chloroflexia bacterium]
MLTPTYIYAVVTLAVLLVFLGIVAVNLGVLPTTTAYQPAPGGQPLVAVLLPARNEASNIEACLQSLLQQNYENITIWVYDDDSDDDTLAITKRLAHSKLRVVEGKGMPPTGWLGKANALHRLYESVRAESEPDYLLFTDADVHFEPEAVSRAVFTAQAWNAGLLSIFPRQKLGTFAERLAVPTMLHWTVYNFLPLPIAFARGSGPAFAAANGQFMLFRREAYEACGGHQAVRSQILEDVALSRAVKASGHRAVLADGGPTVCTRMYNGPGEVWRGYSKNAYAFFGYKPYFLALGVLVLMILYVLPLPLAAVAFLGGDMLLGALLVAQYLIAVQTRLLLAVRFAYPLLDCFLHPLAVLFMVAIQVNSLVWTITGRGAWKGRGIE